MTDDAIGPRRSLAAFIRAFRVERNWPPPDADVQAVVETFGHSNRGAMLCLEWIEATRAAIETYLGREIGDDLSVRLLFGRLQVDFGIGPGDADRLTPIHLSTLLVHLTRWKGATGTACQDTLRQVASIKRAEEVSPSNPEASRVFLKALSAFPDPEPEEAYQSAASRPGFVSATPADSAIVESLILSDEESTPVASTSSKLEPAPRESSSPRNQGKRDRCLGDYITAVTHGEVPPTPTGLARRHGCSVSTASRAIKGHEDKRKAFAKEDQKDRLSRRGG